MSELCPQCRKALPLVVGDQDGLKFCSTGCAGIYVLVRRELVGKIAAGIEEATSHHVGETTPEYAADVGTRIHALLSKLQRAEGHFPEVNLGEIQTAVSNKDPSVVVVTFPPEMTALFEEANARRAAEIEASHAAPREDGYRGFYDRVYGRDSPKGDAHGWVQWKGTDVCMDVHCECGAHGHLDDEFAYYYRCAKCGALFAVGQVVKLIKLEGEDLVYAEEHAGTTIKTDAEAG